MFHISATNSDSLHYPMLLLNPSFAVSLQTEKGLHETRYFPSNILRRCETVMLRKGSFDLLLSITYLHVLALENMLVSD